MKETQYPDIKKYWDGTMNGYAARVLPGQYYVSGVQNEFITTILGSCISACIRDVELQIGGLNHFMLPGDGSSPDGVVDRYGAFAMEHLINDILKLGGRRDRLEVKIFGGGRIMRGLSDVGGKNISFVKAFLTMEGLTAAAEDLGGEFSRKVVYFPTTGKVLIKRLRTLYAVTVMEEEQAYSRQLKEQPAGNDIELFE